MTFNFLGNSHVNFFTKNHPKTIGTKTRLKTGIGDILSCNIGACLAYTFSSKHLPLLQPENFSEKDCIVLVVGEVDCRWHLPLQSDKQKRAPESIVSECVDLYFESFLKLKKLNLNPIAWGPHPSTTGGHDDSYKKPPDTPAYGDCLNRNEITSYFNKYLALKCKDNDIPFVSLFDFLVDDDGLTKMDYFFDYCHLDYSTEIYEIALKKFHDLHIS
jgi:hypothetical protein